MNPSTEDYAQLAKDSYQNRPEYAADPKRKINIHGHQYTVFDYQASPSGFHATAYKQVEVPHGIVIAYRGTDPDHLLTTIQDAAADTIMVAGKINPQSRAAERFTERVLEKAKLQGISPESVTVTGHSLGGALAEAMAYRHHLHGQTFNAFGATELALGIPGNGNLVINNVLDGDPVSAGGQHFGTMRHYATTTDIDSLQAAGYLDGRRGAVSALHAMRLADHSIDNFAPDPGQAPSVLTAANEARAKEHASAITSFRDDIRATRAGLHVTMQPGMPLAVVPATAWGVEGTTAAGLATSAALDKAREVTVRSAHAVGRAAHQVYDATRREVVQDIRSTEKAISQGIDATDRAVQAAAERASEALHTLGHHGNWFDDKPIAPTKPTLDQAAHPDHGLFQQALHGVHQLDAERGRSPDRRSDNLAAALTVQARQQGLNRIDQVTLSLDSSRAFAVQHGVVTQHAQVQTTEAVQTSVAQSSAAWQQVMQQKQTQPSMQPAMPQHALLHGMSR